MKSMWGFQVCKARILWFHWFVQRAADLLLHIVAYLFGMCVSFTVDGLPEVGAYFCSLESACGSCCLHAQAVLTMRLNCEK